MKTGDLLLLLSAFLFLTSTTLAGQKTKLNQIQVLGSHNSYKEAMDAPIMAQLKQLNAKEALALDYAHVSLTKQLDLGLRTLELDVFYDPQGGKYSHPAGIKDQASFGLTAKPLDTMVMNQPGFKVMHVQDIDFRTNCATLELCLQEILDWSAKHPKHLPIAISMNAKEQAIPIRPDFVVPLRFDDAAFAALDAEILAAIPADRIIRPDDIRGQYETLETAVLAHNWPSIKAAKGKFLFILDGGKKQTDIYRQEHPSLQDRVMFATVPEGQAAAAIIFKNNPLNNQAEIQRLVKAGYLVRTRADAGTQEARKGDYSRFEAALASGAHYISTDYYQIDERFGTGYKIVLPGGKAARCNPVLEACKPKHLREK